MAAVYCQLLGGSVRSQVALCAQLGSLLNKEIPIWIAILKPLRTYNILRMEKFTTKDGTSIAYQYRQGQGIPFVFIHGAYLELGAWKPQFAALEARTHVAIDLRGHGQSDNVGQPYSVEQFAEDVEQLLVHLDWDKFFLVGHSLGGMVAQVLAARAPQNIQRLVLIDTSYGVRSKWWEALLTSLTLPLFALIPVAWQARLFAQQIGQHSVEGKAYVQQAISSHADNAANYRAIWAAVVNFDGYADLTQITCPTLILAGGENRQTHRQARIMQQQIPYAELQIIAGAGHLLPWDTPEVLNNVLLRLS